MARSLLITDQALVDELADAETAEPDSRTHGAHGIGYQPIAP